MRKKVVGANVLGAIAVAGAVLGIARSGDHGIPTTPITGQDVSTVTNEPEPVDDDEDDYDVNLEEPVIEPGKPTNLEEFARDSQEGVTPGYTEDGAQGVEGEWGPEGLTFRSQSNP
ncbi:hypothetical protein ACFO5K_19895 [Nocardia halotolerans]|uniref:Uncharacterized protein n=1 Tax=Nocardia halotolerans TaxID=1755878 RepID=A0ABV8VM47_9NOCA